ncbi:MAG: hypothetical protein IKS42_04335 [Oscillospiraceae bacterium]|nr:hypothetical protein [Oscillospiraceae bacterium]
MTQKKAQELVLPVLWLLLITVCLYWKHTDQLTEMLIRGSVVVSGKMQDDLYADRGVYVMRKDGVKITVSPSAETSGEFETAQLRAFCKYVTEQGMDFLYVNAPTKAWLDDSEFSEYFGVPTYSNANADRVMAALREADVPCLDLRENVKAEGKNIYEMFYHTDHHWRAESGLWASGVIAEELNRRYDYGLDLSRYAPENYEFKVYENAWIGEQGYLFSPYYIGYDSFTEIRPKESGSYQFVNPNGKLKEETGDFGMFLAEAQYAEEALPSSDSLHYAYCPHGIADCSFRNLNCPDGKKILLFGDSFSFSFIPFFLQGVSQIDAVILREAEMTPREYVQQEDYDAVVFLYAQFMIGAHDDPVSANYKMLDLMRES